MNKRGLVLFGILALVLIGLFIFRSPTGMVSFDVKNSYNLNQKLNGSLDIIIDRGDLIPHDSLVFLTLKKANKTFVETNFSISSFLGFAPVEISSNSLSCTLGQVCGQKVDFYFNQPGIYSRNVESFINYTFNEAGVYSLNLAVPSVNYSEDRLVNVNSMSLKSLAAMKIVSNCSVISSPGVYGLNQSLTAENLIYGICIRIASNNVVFDCLGNSIENEYLNFTAIQSSGMRNITIQNCNIRMAQRPGSYGVLFNGVSNSYILNSNILFGYYGISMSGWSNYNTVQDVSVMGTSYGISVSGWSSNNTLTGIDASYNNGTGISISGWSDGNMLSNIVANNNNGTGISVSGYSDINQLNGIRTEGNLYGISVSGWSSNNSLGDIVSNGNKNYGVSVSGWSDGNVFQGVITENNNYGFSVSGWSNNNVISNLNSDNNNYSLAVTGYSYNTSLINSYYSNEISSSSELIKKWYYSALVKNKDGSPAQNAYVSGMSSGKKYTVEITTDSLGKTMPVEVVESITYNGVKTYFNNYSFSAYNINPSELNNLQTLESSGVHSYNLSKAKGNINDTFVLGTFQISGNQVSDCRVLDQAGQEYVQIGDIAPTGVGACLNITASNVVFDCKGYSIANSNLAGVGIYASNVENVVIKNCNIRTSVVSGGVGVQFNNVQNSRIVNNILNNNSVGILASYSTNLNISNNSLSNCVSGMKVYETSGSLISGNDAQRNVWEGIWIENSADNVLAGNSLGSNGNHGMKIVSGLRNDVLNNFVDYNRFGIGLFSSSENNLSGNEIIGSRTGYVGWTGIIISEGNANYVENNNLRGFNDGIQIISSNNSIENNNILDNGKGINLEGSNNLFVNNYVYNCTPLSDYFSGCIYLVNSDNNQFIRNRVELSFASAIYLDGRSDNNLFRDGSIINSMKNHTFVDASRYYAKNNSFVNYTYDSDKEFVSSGSELFRKWYYQAYVNDSLGNPVVSVNISVYNRTGQYQFGLLTDSSGFTLNGEIIEYVNVGVRKEYGSYTINSTNVSLQNSHKLNVSGNVVDKFTVYSDRIIDVSAPNFTFVPGNLSLIYGQLFGVDFDAVDDISSVSYFVKSGNFAINSSGWLNNISRLNAGDYLINVSVNDSSGNLRTVVYGLEVNKTKVSSKLSVRSGGK